MIDTPKGSTAESETLSPPELRERLRDPQYLPTRKEVIDAFRHEANPRMALFEFCSDDAHPLFEILNVEFVDALADYLCQRAASLGATEEQPFTIVDLGAGDGRLIHFLKERFETRLPGVVWAVATDSGEWGIAPAFPDETPVEEYDQAQALEVYQPDLVIVSWMPNEVDFTDQIRNTAGPQERKVGEYLLVGEENGCCGDSWQTWGRSTPEDPHTGTPPYEADGFTRESLDGVSKFQTCRSDTPGRFYDSSTTSFRRLQ